jgi:glutathione S-transferase
MEYLDEIARKTSGRSLLPSDEYARSLVRLLSEYVTKEGRGFYAILTAKTDDDLDRAKKAYVDGINGVEAFYRRMEIELKDSPESLVKAVGLWHEGGELGWIDVLLAPWLSLSMTVLKRYRGFEWPQQGKVSEWAKRVLQHSSVRATCSEDDVYLSYYKRYVPSEP